MNEEFDHDARQIITLAGLDTNQSAAEATSLRGAAKCELQKPRVNQERNADIGGRVIAAKP